MAGSELSETTIVAGDTDAGERIDKFIAGAVGSLSRSRVAALLREGHVSGPGGKIVEASYRVKPGERFQVVVPPPEDATPSAQAIALTILYEDEDIIVIDKPAGLVVHPGAGNPSGTLVNALIAHCGESLSGIGGVRRPGIVHRLDKDTSGVMVAAKNDLAHRELARQFADHGREGVLKRCYLALVWGVPKRRSGVVDQPIGRHRTDRLRQAVARNGQGRAARTHYRVEETYLDARGEPIAALVRCQLETGRTHQVRVHMDFLGTPVIGDNTYGRSHRSKARRLGKGAMDALERLGRQGLHASTLRFAHPRDQRVMTFRSPLPTEMARLTVQMSQA